MLIVNRSKLVYKLDLCLEMDDGTVQNQEVKEGDIVHLKFRYNGFVLTKQGVVKKINPSRIMESQFVATTRLSAIMDLDCSEQYRNELYKVDISDILEILPVYVTMGEPDHFVEDPDIQVTPDGPSLEEMHPIPPQENEEDPNNGIELAKKTWEDFGDYLREAGKK